MAVLDDYQQVAAGYADWSGLDVDFVDAHLTGDVLVARLADREVVVAMRERTPFPRSLLERLPALRMLVTTGMRNASIDRAAAAALGITVTGTSALRTPTSELTWALIMGLIRPVGGYDADVRAGRWQRTVGGDLAGRTLGLVGLGNQGRAVAAVGAAFGMRVVAWSPHLTAERAAAGGATLVGREELFATADVVSLHMVLAAGTTGIVGERELRAMRSESFLVNTSRALLIDQDALRRAVEQEWLAGVALDVFDVEPIPAGHWLLTSPRTLLSPHMGYVSDANYRRCFADVVENIAAYRAGEPIRRLDH
ncbi:MAG TPA: D-2-hydroxyacid dehydrogenase family protein [Pseudonocardiaceae bacterium]|nr:D-2-hydroxyacid dehydrogenase family protein [Pseudonocardiaceae bacterium]